MANIFAINRSDDNHATSEALYAITESGATVSPFPITPNADASYYGVAVGGGYAFISSNEYGIQKIDSTGTVVASRPASDFGTDLWRLHYRDGYLYVPNYSPTGSIYKLNASDLTTVWEFTGGGAYYMDVDSSGNVLFTHVNASSGHASYRVVRKVNSSGNEVTTGNFPLDVPTATTLYGVAVDASDDFYVASYTTDAPITKFSNDGTFQWAVTDTNVRAFNTSDLVVDSLGNVVGTDSYALFSVDPSDGSVNWYHELTEEAPGASGRSMIYLYGPSADESGNTYWTAGFSPPSGVDEGWLLAKVNSSGEIVWETVLATDTIPTGESFFFQTAYGNQDRILSR